MGKDADLKYGDELLDDEEVYRIAQLPISGDFNFNPHKIGPWYFESEHNHPHELSILRGRKLTAKQAQRLRIFKDPNKDKMLVPYRRTLRFSVENARESGNWDIIYSPIKGDAVYNDNPHHAHMYPWTKKVYDGNFTDARRKLLEKATWATSPIGTKWVKYPNPSEGQSMDA